ncbi:MAG: malonyl-ACP O-methyltransferase BioC [Acidiferrobacteraceae bacterium]
MNSPFLDKRQIRTAFERAASGYDHAAPLQRMVGDRLLERLDVLAIAPQRVLDAGAGTGYCLPLLRRRYSTTVIALDLALAMLHQARRRDRWRSRSPCVCADAEQLPLAQASVGLVLSNLTLQWCDAEAAFREFARVLAPEGLLLFSSFGPDTLKEVRAAWAGVDDEAHVHDFVDMHDLGDGLVRSGFSEPVLDVDRITLRYSEASDILSDLKGLGAHNARTGRFSGLTGKDRFRRFEERLSAGRGEDGRIPVTFEVVYGQAWRPDTPPEAEAMQPVPVHWLRRPR